MLMLRQMLVSATEMNLHTHTGKVVKLHYEDSGNLNELWKAFVRWMSLLYLVLHLPDAVYLQSVIKPRKMGMLLVYNKLR